MLSNSTSKNGFLRVMLERQAASCIPATLDYVRDAIKCKKIELENDDSGDVWQDAEDGQESISLQKKELAFLEEMEAKFTDAVMKEDQKFIEFKTALQQAVAKGSKKIIVFSYFKRTLRYLKARIKKDMPKINNVEIISGDVDAVERNEIISRFWKSDGTYVLLASEVGGEGLDLQISNCVFNYDLPWNPMVVEQRIGRIDRFGQKSSKIHIYNFIIRDTVEERILYRLYERIGIFESSIGELEPLLGSDVEELTNECFSSALTANEAETRMENLLMAIEKKKKETEMLEKQRQDIIGLDEFFTEQVNSIKAHKRFVTHQEIEFFTQYFLSQFYPHSKIENRGNNTWTLVPDKKLKKKIYDSILDFRFTSSEPEMRRFSALVDKDEKIKLTFDQKTATEDPSIEFITLRHALVLMAIKDMEMVVGREQVFAIKTGQRGVFFIYMIEVGQRAMSPYLEAVLVKDGKATLYPEITKLEFESLAFSVAYSTLDFTSAKKLADELIAEREKAIYQAHLSECAKLAAVKKRNVQVAIELAIKKLETRLNETSDTRLRRMYISMIEKRKSELESRLAFINSETQISIRHKVIAGGVSS